MRWIFVARLIVVITLVGGFNIIISMLICIVACPALALGASLESFRSYLFLVEVSLFRRCLELRSSGTSVVVTIVSIVTVVTVVWIIVGGVLVFVVSVVVSALRPSTVAFSCATTDGNGFSSLSFGQLLSPCPILPQFQHIIPATKVLF